MRTDLESAMAAVITSPSEHRRFIQNPAGYAATFPLEAGDASALIEMGGDLAALTGSFVMKRARTVRWNARRTIAMLGEPGQALLDEFVDRFPGIESFREEARIFGDFVIERTEAMRDRSLRYEIIAEMALFERHRSDAFWESVTPLDTRQPTRTRRPASQRRKAGLRLRPGASVGRFRWDLRVPYRHRVAPLRLLQPDPCQLLFFHNGTPDGIRVLRVRPEEAALIQRLQEGGTVSTDAVRGPGEHPGDLDRLVSRFVWQGVIQWV